MHQEQKGPRSRSKNGIENQDSSESSFHFSDQDFLWATSLLTPGLTEAYKKASEKKLTLQESSPEKTSYRLWKAAEKGCHICQDVPSYRNAYFISVDRGQKLCFCSAECRDLYFDEVTAGHAYDELRPQNLQDNWRETYESYKLFRSVPKGAGNQATRRKKTPSYAEGSRKESQSNPVSPKTL